MQESARARPDVVNFTIGRGQQLNGPEGLLTAVIWTATTDVLAGYAEPEYVESALAYFDSPLYRRHLTWLGLPNDWMPVGLDAGRMEVQHDK